MKRTAPFVFSAAAFACAPDFDVRSWRVDGERFLAVVAEPAEARPRQTVSYSSLFAGPNGRLDNRRVEYAYCQTPKPLSENNTVAEGCLDEPGLALLPDSRDSASGPIPADACRLFGPDPPPGDARPRDPDTTGGYYQPVRVTSDGLVAVHLQRITCSPGDVAVDVGRAFDESYVPNANPSPVRLGISSSSEAAPDVPVRVSANADIVLVVEWAADAQERYAHIDRERQLVVEQVETLRVDWFATAGSLKVDHDEVTEPSSTRATNQYRAPSDSGPAWLWVVVHDSRRGTSFAELQVLVI